MFTPRRLSVSCLLVLCLLTTVLAQAEQPGNIGQKPSQTTTTVTASATAERVRFTAPGNVVRMQLQVFSESGQILFDVNSRGNVLDWSLQDGSGQRLQGAYLTVVTVKSISGRLSERIGTVSVEEKQVKLKAGETKELTAAQQQAVGPVEEKAMLTILQGDEGQAVTVVANDGKDGQIVRESGALSFRLGDFFSGKDKEQMRLTEDGSLGIGTTKPRFKLDVAGEIRARQGFVFGDGSTLNVNDKGALTLTNGRDKGALTLTNSNGNVVPNTAGSGTQDRLAKWTDNAGTLGDSVVTESAGNIGLGTSSPGAPLEVQQPASPTVPNMYLSQAATPSKGVFQFIKVGANTWSYFGHNVQFNGTANVLLDPTKSGWAFYANGDVTDAFYVYSVPPAGGSNYPFVLKRDGRLKLSSGNFIPPGNNQLEVQVQNPAYVGAVIKASPSQSASLQEWQNSSGTVLSKIDSSGNLSVGTTTSPTGGVATFNGSVGIGTTTPGSKLDVAGDINTSTQYEIGGARVFSIAGTSNMFAGSGAGNSNTSGIQNSFFGNNAGGSNTAGNNNTFVGSGTGQSSTTANNNSFFGNAAGGSNTTGESNSFFGTYSGFSNTTGQFNSFFGTSAGSFNTTGPFNSFFGYGAGSSNTTGQSNSFFGNLAGSGNTTANGNSFFGDSAGKANTTATGNSFFGSQAGFHNTTGFSNSFFGLQAGINNTTGQSNSFFGGSAGFFNTTGCCNSFFGLQAGINNTIGISNSFFGLSAGFNNTTGQSNSFFGAVAGQNNTTGSRNIFIGPSSGLSNTIEDNNTFIGTIANGAVGITNATALGYRAQVTQSDSLVLGGVNGFNGATADTKVGIGTRSPSATLHISNTTAPTIRVDSTSTIGTWLQLINTSTGGRDWNLISSGSANGEGAGKIFFYDGSASATRMLIDASGNVGIGTAGPNAKLHVSAGDAAITTQGNGLILRATDGPNCYRITVNNAGTLAQALVTCP